jgi:hypothetical protein
LAQIEILATDGRHQKRVAWINATPNGIYVGWCTKDANNIHVSYHKDGNVFLAFEGRTERIAIHRPLRKFREIYPLCTLTLAAELSELHAVDYNLQKLKAAAYLDVRALARTSALDCDIYLVEPCRFDLLRKLTNSYTRQVQLFTQFRPWIALSVSGGNKLDKDVKEGDEQFPPKLFGVGVDIGLIDESSYFGRMLKPYRSEKNDDGSNCDARTIDCTHTKSTFNN